MGNSEEPISFLVDQMVAGKIVLPDIQRDYVWRGTQVPRFLDSLNRQWPVGSILLWDTHLDVPTKAAAIVQSEPSGIHPAILLDGQQRLTTLARVFAPECTPPGERVLDVRYNPLTEQFSNANAIQRRDKNWIPASMFLRNSAQFRDVVRSAGMAEPSSKEEDAITDHLSTVSKNIRGYKLSIQTIAENDYERVAEIFNRVNTGGRRLSKGDLVMGALAARWPSGRRQVEDFESELAAAGWRLNREVLLRVTSVITKGSSNHIRLVELKDKDEWQQGWQATESAIRHVVQFFKRDADIANLSLLLTEYLTVIPAVVMYRQRGALQPGQAAALRRWLYIAGAFAHYSGSTETTLAADLNLLGGTGDQTPFASLLRAAQAPRTPGSRITLEDLRGKGMRSPFLRLMQLRAVQTKAESWWSHRALTYGSTLDSLKVEVHHIFPKGWLRKLGVANHPERDTLSNFAFLSKFDNTKISDQNPTVYLAKATPAELAAQWVPQDPALWTAERFADFCAQRRQLIANALNDMLGLDGPADADALAIPDEGDEPEVGAWAEDLQDDPDAVVVS